MRRGELSILMDARDLLARGFCQGAFARDIFGADLAPDGYPYGREQGAVAWCPAGALFAARRDRVWQYDLEGRLADRAGATSLDVWADEPERTLGEVLALFDAEIAALAEERGEPIHA